MAPKGLVYKANKLIVASIAFQGVRVMPGKDISFQSPGYNYNY
jgi:hypothetical protein